VNLKQYDRLKTDLGEVLRSATARPGLERNQEAVHDIYARLAEDRFNLVVVGRFSRGKSSLMNAMLGTDQLPTGIVPVTSVITAVSYGTVEQVVLHYQHTSLFLEIPISELANHITESGNPGNVKRVRIAEVQLPAELLRRGFHFVDTPGLGSSILENTRTTEAFLPEADAFILVTSFDSPLSEEELRILTMVRKSGRWIFVVINKQDYADAPQRRQVLDHLEAQLRSLFGESPPPLFSVSARDASAARARGNIQELAASGVPAFENTLAEFLLNRKSHEFLMAICGRIAALIDRQPGAENDRVKLARMRAEIAAMRPGAAPTLAVVERPAIPPTVPACEICAKVVGDLFDFFAKYQSRLARDSEARSELAASCGLCAPHTLYFEAIAAPKEVCSGFADLAEHQAARLRAIAEGDPTASLACEAVEATLPNADTCPACHVARRAGKVAAAAVAGRLTRETIAALDTLSAVCLPHLGLLVGCLNSPELVRMVLHRQADLLDRLSEDMRHFALKRDGLKRHLITKEEAAAGERGLRTLAGHPRAQVGPSAPVRLAASGASSKPPADTPVVVTPLGHFHCGYP
jgi:small GTP-binding protein